MEFIFEVLIGPIIEMTTEAWIGFMKKKNPHYKSRFLVKIVTVLVIILIVLLFGGAFLGILFLLEWLFPHFLDVVEF